ncbi:MAG: hypothetical protein L6461_21510 [Anaerolineae bacterium]|nr:hypothetical protein [Anaerolineae bacterium]
MNFTEKIIDGISLRELRDFLHRHWGSAGNEVQIDSLLIAEWRRAYRKNPVSSKDVEEKRASVLAETKRILKALFDAGFITNGHQDDIKLTEKGTRLKASSLRRYSRGAAQKQLEQFIARCNDINTRIPTADDPISLCRIQKAIIFGSFARGDENVGDLDVYVEIVVKEAGEQAIKGLFRKLRGRHPLEFTLSYLQRNLTIIQLSITLPPGVPESEMIDCGV